MKLGKCAHSLLLFALLLMGCTNRPEVIPTLVLPAKTSMPIFTATLPAPPTEVVSLTNTPSPDSEERLSQLPPLSLPEFNARYSTGDIALSADGRFLAAVSKDRWTGEQSIWIWDVSGFDQSFAVYQVTADELWSVAFSPNGNILAIGCVEKIVIFEWKTGNPTQTIELPDFEIVQLSFGNDNTLVWSDFDDQVTVWDLSRNEVKYVVNGITGFKPNSFAISSDGRILVTGDSMGIQLWDFETGHPLGFRDEPKGGIGIVPVSVFSSTGDFFASTGCSEFIFEGCSRGKIIIWKSDIGTPSVVTDLHSGWIDTLAFSTNDEILASSSGGGILKLLYLANGEIVNAPPTEVPGKLPPADPFLITDIVFILDGKTLAASTKEGIQLLDIASMSWMPHLRFILSLNYSYTIATEGDNLNFRTEPSMQGEILKRLHKGEWFFVIDGPKIVDEQVWWKVKIEDDSEGWIVEMPGWYEFVP